MALSCYFFILELATMSCIAPIKTKHGIAKTALKGASMSTAIFFNTPAYGHINPTLPVVTELVKRGERVIYYAMEEFRAAIEHIGAIFCSYEHLFWFMRESIEE